MCPEVWDVEVPEVKDSIAEASPEGAQCQACVVQPLP